MFNCISTGKVAYQCRDDINEEGADTENSTSCFAGVENCNNILRIHIGMGYNIFENVMT
jgi:hypothetical protein